MSRVPFTNSRLEFHDFFIINIIINIITIIIIIIIIIIVIIIINLCFTLWSAKKWFKSNDEYFETDAIFNR